MQTTLILPGTIVTSRITGARILVTRIYPDLIVGMLEGFKPYPLAQSGMRMCDGTRILSKKNIL
jgi:hypothetical protein